MRNLRRILGILLFAAVLVAGWRFAGSNSEPVGIDYLFGRIEAIPLWGALAGAFLLGVTAATTLAAIPLVRLRLRARRLRKAAEGLESEVHQLRNLPLAEEEARPPRGSSGGAPDFRGPTPELGRGG